MQKVYSMHSNGIAALGDGGMVTEPEMIVQFTGMHDVNGVEIYEGDIVVSKYHKSRSDPESVKYDPKYGFTPIQEPVDYDETYSDKWEVIGNIYENPELLP